MERRRSKRVAVQIQAERLSCSNNCSVFIENLSESGIQMITAHGDESKIGAYTGLYYFSSQSAAILGPVLSGLVVESLGNNYRWLWLFSTVFMFLALMAINAIRNSPPKAAGV